MVHHGGMELLVLHAAATAPQNRWPEQGGFCVARIMHPCNANPMHNDHVFIAQLFTQNP